MQTRGLVFCALCWATWAFGAAVAEAAPPWSMLFTSSVEADPEKPYHLSESNGPWMILACSFSGEGAAEQAHQLVLELRSRYKLEAYVHKVRFQLGEAPVRGVNRFGEPRRGKYRPGSEIEEYAVMVGNYSTVDDPEGQKVLNKLKLARPQCLELREDRPTNQTLAGWRLVQRQVQSALGSDKKTFGPMGHAFVTTNPMLPSDFFNAQGIDEFVLRLNSDVKHSLLNCPGKFTVKVATFTGEVILDQKEIQQSRQRDQQRDQSSKLIEAGEKAEKLTEALRKLNYDAYCLHDRYASIVCVGSFESVGTPRPDGKTEIDPQIYRIMETFRGEPVDVPGQTGAIKPKQLVGLYLDIQPVPVQVPKVSIGASYSRSLLSTR